MDKLAIFEQAQTIASSTVAANADSVDRNAQWPEQAIRKLQQAGLGGLVVPKTSGGLGQGMATLVKICETIGRECASTALCFGMHCVGTAVIVAKATKEQQRRYLAPICQGKHLTTLALSEPGTGAHFYFPQTRLETVSQDEFVVNGSKTFVTNGGYADSYVISTVAADPDAGPGQFSCAICPQNAKGLVWGAPWDGLGMRGNSSRLVELRNVTVPRYNLLGEEGDQLWYIFYVVAPYFLTAMAGTYLGIADAALMEVQNWLKERIYKHNHSSLAQISVLQHRLGTLWSGVERTRRLVYYAASEADSGGANALPALCSAKADVAECAVNTVNEAMTLMGGIGYREHAKLGRLLRDARAAHVMAPTTDLLRVWTGRALLDQPLLEE